jgi:hypothetical protein
MVQQAGWVHVGYGNFGSAHYHSVKLFLQYFRTGLVSDCTLGFLQFINTVLYCHFMNAVIAYE